MPIVTLFLKRYWKELIVVGFIGFFLYQNFAETRFLFGLNTIPSLKAQNEKLKQEKKQLEENFEICQQGNKTLSTAIENQNKQIEAIGQLAKQFDEQFGHLSSKIDAMRSQTAKSVQDILNAPPPQSCEDAIRYLHEGAQGGFQWKK